MWILLSYLLSGFPAAAQTVGISAEVPAVEIGPGRYTLKAGSEVFVTVHITNVSSRSLSLDYDADSRTGVAATHSYEVRDGSGNSAEKRSISHPELASTGHGWPSRTLEPGASMDIPGDHISRLYHLDRPGEYTIQLIRTFSDRRKSYFVKSNTISLKVTE